MPPCPSPGAGAAVELAAIYASGLETDDLHAWLSAMTLYCDALEE